MTYVPRTRAGARILRDHPNDQDLQERVKQAEMRGVRRGLQAYGVNPEESTPSQRAEVSDRMEELDPALKHLSPAMTPVFLEAVNLSLSNLQSAFAYLADSPFPE